MKVRTWLLPLASLTAVVGVTAWEFASARMGPGPLHPAHAQLDSLSGGQCASCHRAGAGIDADACIECHRPIGDQRASLTGLHGSLPASELATCNKCHREHHGARTPLIAPQAFSNAGVPDVAGYDHRHVRDYRLAGAHRALGCDQCHPAATAALPPPGGRFLGVSQACAACHDDVHRGAFGSGCEECHGQEQEFRTAPGFQHQIFPLVGEHSRVACADCHKPGTPHDTAALSLRPQPARTCAHCHEDPHRPSGGRPARAMLLGNTHDCSRCHEASAWATANVTPEQHAQFGFPLRGGHAAAECASCHGDGTRPTRHTPPMPGVAACARCHENPHEATFLRAARVAKGRQDGCAGCHDDADTTFRQGRTTPQQHAVTGFLLTAPHANVECRKCHDGDTWQQRFPGRKAADCRACHQDEHRGQFDHSPRYGQCTSCHLQTTFRPVAFDTQKHALTAFPLTGSHDAVACARCHREVRDGVRTFHGTSTECASCHEDVHKGAFDGIGKPRQIQGRTGCARCHDTTAFSPMRTATFDHGTWTGYPLDGAHARAECIQCHPPTAQDRQRPRLGKAIGRQCADCHRDQHQGQFVAAGKVDCARCHGPAQWQPTHFDHDRDSRFRLDAQHAPLACDKCHKTYASAAGPVVRYKPLGTQCGDCHRLGSVKGFR